MPPQHPQGPDCFTCPICYNTFSEQKLPLSLVCGHVVCKVCLIKLDQRKCPLDQSALVIPVRDLPVNNALLLVMGCVAVAKQPDVGHLVGKENGDDYKKIVQCVEDLADYLHGFIRPDGQTDDLSSNCGMESSLLSRPMQRKLISLISCQLLEEEGRARACRAARSVGERTVSELILMHQNPQQLSAYLWAAVRARGCQFLGPAMQEEVLKSVLSALQDGAALSRKVLVLYVVQHLEKLFPHASKTAIGHVVQLLYRASCFKVTKREDESSLMQLKEEFCTYESLRREHDSQIVQVASEAGLRIAPEQWSSLLYGDALHKSHMQSIIDKLQTPESFAQNVTELVIALQRTSDTANLSLLKAPLELLASIDLSPDARCPAWQFLYGVIQAVCSVTEKFCEFLQTTSRRSADLPGVNHGKFKTSMCRDFAQRGACPRASSCTFAHSIDEMERYRARNRRTRIQAKYGQTAVGDFGDVLIPPSSGLIPCMDRSATSIVRPSSMVTSTSLAGGVTSVVSSLGGTIATSSIAPPCTAIRLSGHVTPTVMAPALTSNEEMTYTATESRYGQHRVQQTLTRVPSATYQDSKYTSEHLDLTELYQASIASKAPNGEHEIQVASDLSVSCPGRALSVYHAQMGSQPLNTPYPIPSDKMDDYLPRVQMRNQSILEKLFRRRDELIANLGPSALDTVLTRDSCHLATGHVCGCHVSADACCHAYYQPQRHGPSNVMTPRIMTDQVMARPCAFTDEELSRSVSDSAVTMRLTSRVELPGQIDVGDEFTRSALTNGVGESGRGSEDASDLDAELEAALRVTMSEANDSDFEDDGSPPPDESREVPRDCWKFDFNSKPPVPVARPVNGPGPGPDEPDVLWFQPDSTDDLIPFDPPLVSRYGPISRAARMKIDKNTAPRVADALKGASPTPVTAVTPTSRPYPSAYQSESAVPPIGAGDAAAAPSRNSHAAAIGHAIAHSLPTANIKLEPITHRCKANAQPQTLWSMKQKLEYDGKWSRGPQSIAEREQLKHELDLLEQQIHMVAHDEMLVTQLRALELQPTSNVGCGDKTTVAHYPVVSQLHAVRGAAPRGQMVPRYASLASIRRNAPSAAAAAATATPAITAAPLHHLQPRIPTAAAIPRPLSTINQA